MWSDDRAESQIAFSSFEHFARNAERGFFDYLFLAEGLRLREQKGRIHDLDVVGRPNTLAVLAALAGVTEHIGLVGTLQTTFNEPLELAKQLATLDHLTDGRAGWNVVTSSDAFHGANFRRGGFLDHAERYTRAAEFIELSRELWDSWRPTPWWRTLRPGCSPTAPASGTSTTTARSSTSSGPSPSRGAAGAPGGRAGRRLRRGP